MARKERGGERQWLCEHYYLTKWSMEDNTIAIIERWHSVVEDDRSRVQSINQSINLSLSLSKFWTWRFIFDLVNSEERQGEGQWLCEHDYLTKWPIEDNTITIIGRWYSVEEDDRSRVQSLSLSKLWIEDSYLIWLIQVTHLICEGSYE